jgi:hypothetical protein
MYNDSIKLNNVLEDYMEIIFMITFLMIVAWIALLLKLINMDKEKAKRIKEEGILYESHLIHLGGHPYLSANEEIYFQIRKNNTIFFYKENSNTGEEIPINQITRYELKTESEIQKDVTLTRLLALGIFAFGLKKKTEINNTYFILSYVQNNVPIDCIFKNTVNNQQLGNIISMLNRLKIEQNIQGNPNI